MRSSGIAALSLVALATATTACRSRDSQPAQPVQAAGPTLATQTPGATQPAAGSPYRATIRWTRHGIPHIVADDLGGLAFGQGYAFARLHACHLADQVMRIRGQSARHVGPGPDNANIDADFGYLALALHDRARAAWPALGSDSRAVYSGYAAGFNHYLAEVGRAALPPACAGAAWVQPLDGIDILAHSMDVAIVASSGLFVEAIGAAQPGRARGANRDTRPRARPASNAWAIGAERSSTGRGMLVANPHYPWVGPRKFYEIHLTMPGSPGQRGSPGTIDVYGAALLGTPLVNIGFTEHHAWSHTVSDSRRIVFYRLSLADGQPTRYRHGSEARSMIATRHTIEVKNHDGTVRPMTRTLYRSHHGPIVTGHGLPWNKTHAFALHDVALGITTLADQYLALARATSLDEFRQALARYQGMPFVNTIYADREGNAFYADTSLVPDLAPHVLQLWIQALDWMPELRATYDAGVVMLDGSLPLFELQHAAGAAHPGVIPLARAPQAVRRDFVMNANDSYWLANPAEPLGGHSPFYGQTRSPISSRTRMNLMMLTETGKTAASGADNKFSVDELQTAILGNRASTAEVWREAVIARCRTARNLAALCDTLARWDGRVDTDSVGAVLWREFLGSFSGGDPLPGWLIAEPFDPDRPIETPRGLVPARRGTSDPVIEALIEARDRLTAMGLDPLTVSLGQLQYMQRGDQRIPVHGGNTLEGTTNLAMFQSEQARTMPPELELGALVNPRTDLTKSGYPINYGTSFLLIVGYTAAGPEARAIMTYSASSDPGSPHFRDQSELYSRKQLRPVLFHQADIEADPELVVQTIQQ